MSDEEKENYYRNVLALASLLEQVMNDGRRPVDRPQAFSSTWELWDDAKAYASVVLVQGKEFISSSLEENLKTFLRFLNCLPEAAIYSADVFEGDKIVSTLAHSEWQGVKDVAPSLAFTMEPEIEKASAFFYNL